MTKPGRPDAHLVTPALTNLTGLTHRGLSVLDQYCASQVTVTKLVTERPVDQKQLGHYAGPRRGRGGRGRTRLVACSEGGIGVGCPGKSAGGPRAGPSIRKE